MRTRMKPASKPAIRRSTLVGHAIAKKGSRTSPTFARRAILMVTGLAVLLPGSGHSTSAHSSTNKNEAILQPATTEDIAFMQRAFEMRQLAIDYGDQAYGAVVVRDDIIIGQSWSRVILDSDPTAHAEISAIRDAARRSNSRDLTDAVIYSSSRPCPMCEAAAYWANIGQMTYGRGITTAGSPKLCG